MEQEYRWVLTQADADPAVRVVVVTGAGRGFCAGADFEALGQLAGGAEYPSAATADGAGDGDAVTFEPGPFGHRFTFPLGMSKPVIAAVNGPAAGVGFVLMCFADIRFAAAGAKLTTSFARLGLPAEVGVSWVLSRLIGAGRAADLLFSSRVVLAEEAVDMGLVNAVLPGEELMPFTLDYARRLAAQISPSSLRAMKRQLWDDMAGDLDTAVTVAVETLERMVKE